MNNLTNAAVVAMAAEKNIYVRPYQGFWRVNRNLMPENEARDFIISA